MVIFIDLNILIKKNKINFVKFLVPPQLESIKSQLITKREGESFTLLCPVKSEDLDSKARKESELRITWAKDGRPIDSLLLPNYEVLV